MASDAHRHSDYDPSLIDSVLGEAAHLLRHLGFAATHTILIGGVVPSLLVLDPATNRAHVGTTDLDLCLSVAIIEGDTADYERIETALRKAGYEPTDASFRWRGTTRLKLEVEFFCPAAKDRPSGRMFRPKAADNPVAKQNLGAKLAAIALDAGTAISDDAQTVTRTITLPAGAGITTFDFRVTGIVGFLVAKIGALVGRDKPKDAYDIVWIIENWEGGPAGAATSIKTSGPFVLPEVKTALARLAQEFETPGHLGPRSYARFLTDASTSTDDELRIARQAAGAVAELNRYLHT